MKQGWRYKNLGEVADFYRGLTYGKQDESESSDVCVLRSNNIDLESMSLNFDEIKYLRNDFSIPSEKKLKKNSIFICMSNGSKQHVGKVAFVDRDMDYAFGGFMGLIIPSNDVSAKYIYYACRSSLYRRFLNSIGNGIGITNLKFTDLATFTFPVPTIEKQKEIVSELDLLSDIIEKQKSQVKEMDKLAQSIFYDMFGDTNNNPKHFEVRKLDEVCSLKAGKTIKAEELSDCFSEDLYPCYGGNGIRGYINRYSHNGMYPIIGRQGALCGNVNLASGQFYATEHAVVVMPIININAIWLYYVLQSMRLSQYAHGVAQPGLSVKDLNPLSLIIPPLSLQHEFAAKIEAIETMKAKVRQSLKEAEQLFKSRMDIYFN